MKIAILGTRGVPNQYGGFEQLAAFLSVGLQREGHEVIVYCSSLHPYKHDTWNGVKLVHKWDPEDKVGSAGQFLYDLGCIVDSRKRGFDVILNLGYTSSAIWMRFFRRSVRIVTNMDGLEWKRSKYSDKVKRFLRYSERLAVRKSHALIADSLAIQSYLQNAYGVNSSFIPYGANLITTADPELLLPFSVSPRNYNLLIARMEPENNIEVILDGVKKSKLGLPFVVVGNIKNAYGAFLVKKYGDIATIRFAGPVYDESVVNSLRLHSNLYFHGHSVGGTNPSLLEAMGSRCLIAAHKNEFNESVLGKDAFYFSNADDVATIMTNTVRSKHEDMIDRNVEKIRTTYSWVDIIRDYERVLESKQETVGR